MKIIEFFDNPIANFGVVIGVPVAIFKWLLLMALSFVFHVLWGTTLALILALIQVLLGS